MIVAMRKAHVICRRRDRDRLLEALGRLGVVHVQPLDPQRARADEKTLREIEHLERASQLLRSVSPAGAEPDVSPADAAAETLRIQRESVELRGRLTTLRQQLRRLEMWGEVRLEQFDRLREAGIEVRFFQAPKDAVGQIEAECVAVLGPAGGGVLVAAASRSGQIVAPQDARAVELPACDRPALRAEAAEIDETLRGHGERLARLARRVDAIEAEAARLRREAHYTAVQRGGLAAGGVYAVQGWVPQPRANALERGLEAEGVDAAVAFTDPADDETPPTLIAYPRWVRPIQGLFDILATFPGYRELDLSPFFMLAMPLFAAMLIGDAGYGLLIVLGSLLGYRKLTAVAGKPKTHLLLIFGAATLIWGLLTGNVFGVTPADLGVGPDGGGSAIGRAMAAVGVLWRADTEAGRYLIIKISFLVACLHLVSGHLRQAARYAPHPKAVGELGWAAVIVGMLGVVWMLFQMGVPRYFSLPPVLRTASLVLVGGGFALAVLFAHPDKRLAARLGVGLAGSLLPLLNAFSDTMSYIRLMAVGLASYYIAAAFNQLAAMVAEPNAALWALAAPVLVFGHALNIGLAAIAIFAHGVRLNMLEFSNHAGVQWSGYAYQPFAEAPNNEPSKES